jgi:WD40 repeat protein
MSARGRLLVVGLILHVLSNVGPAQDKPAVDPYGDPLPAGARARIGTIRFRHGGEVTFVAFLDARTLLSAGADNVIRVWEVPTGKELRTLARKPEGLGPLVVSPDGKTLALVDERPSLRLLDTHTGKLRHKLDQPNGVNSVAFASDGRGVVFLSGDQAVYRWAPESGTPPQQVFKAGPPAAGQNPFQVTSVLLSPDGTVLAAGGVQGPTGSVRLWDVAAKRELKTLTGFQNGVVAVCFSPDSKTLAVTDGMQQMVHLYEVATGKSIRKQAQPGVTALAFAPDGKALTTAANDGIRFLEPATGKEVRKLAADGSNIYALAFSPDGRWLAAGTDAFRIRLWDLKTDKEVAVPNANADRLLRIELSSDGKLLATAGTGTSIHVWDAATGRHLRQLDRKKPVADTGLPEGLIPGVCIAFVSEKDALAAGYLDGKLIFWDARTGKELRSFLCSPGGITGLAPAADGKILAVAGADANIRLWDVARGRERRRIRAHLVPADTPAGIAPTGVFGIAISGDGRTVGTKGCGPTPVPEGGATVRLYESSTGQIRRQIALPSDQEGRPPVGLGIGGGVAGVLSAPGTTPEIGGLTFSPRGRHVVVGTDDTVRLYDIARGRELRRFGGKDVLAATAVFTHDGKTLLAGDAHGRIHFWDVDTGTALFEAGEHRAAVVALNLSRDGKVLASACADGTALIWDVAQLTEKGRAENRPAARDLDALWNDLAANDAARAFDAICALTSDPARAVPLLRDRLQPMPSPDRAKIDRLIADLNSERFGARNKAGEALEKLGDVAEPALRQALAGRPSLEVRRRIEHLLERIDGPIREPEQLRHLRAIEILEQIGTPPARQVLEKLAHGAPGARRTREAQAALDRLAKEQAPPRLPLTPSR